MESSKAGEFQFKMVKPAGNVFVHVEGNTISSDYE
jgi:hypothetical protein